MEEEEDGTNDPLEMSARRGGEIGANRYGVAADVIQHLSSRSIDTFRPLSDKWHSFLGLSSYRPGRQKRLREEAEPSSEIQGRGGVLEAFQRLNKQYQELPASQRGDTTWQTAWDFGSTPDSGSNDVILPAMRKALGRQAVSYRSDT